MACCTPPEHGVSNIQGFENIIKVNIKKFKAKVVERIVGDNTVYFYKLFVACYIEIVNFNILVGNVYFGRVYLPYSVVYNYLAWLDIDNGVFFVGRRIFKVHVYVDHTGKSFLRLYEPVCLHFY